MKLKITDTSWGINRMNGKYGEKVCGEAVFECTVGDIPGFGSKGRRFTVDEAGDGTVRISVHCANSAFDRTWTIKEGEEAVYRPRSFDGGHFYTFRLIGEEEK